MTTKVFVYGTLKKGFPNDYFLNDKDKGTAVYKSKARTKEKYPLVIDESWGSLPFLLHLAGVGSNVAGEIYEVDDKMLKNLDLFEDVGVMYDAFKINVLNEFEQEEECLVYFMHGIKDDLINSQYFDVYTLSLARHYSED